MHVPAVDTNERAFQAKEKYKQRLAQAVVDENAE
jgi:hypothetical protein